MSVKLISCLLSYPFSALGQFVLILLLFTRATANLQAGAFCFTPFPISFCSSAAPWNFSHGLIEFTGLLPSCSLVFFIWSSPSSFFKACELSFFQDFHELTHLPSSLCLTVRPGWIFTPINFFLHQKSLPNPFPEFMHSLSSTSFPAQQLKSPHWHHMLCLRWLSSLLIKSTINLISLVRWFLTLPCEITQKILPCTQSSSCSTSFQPSSEKMMPSPFLFCLHLGGSCHPLPYLHGPGKETSSICSST